MAALPMIGDTEEVELTVAQHGVARPASLTFTNRLNAIPNEKQGYPPNKICPDLNRNYELTEYKTSLLVRELKSNPGISDRLVTYLRYIALRLMQGNQQLLYIELQTYMQQLALGMNLTQDYPVAQSMAWVNPDNILELQNDFYAYFNFVKWIY
jgi:hypothetical protein